jgi:hypothetical protein
MISTGASVFVATQPVDFRKGASGLAALVRDCAFRSIVITDSGGR